MTEKTDAQPVAVVQWIDREQLSANDWNPNHQAPPEHRLLATSILENGWTQPIVARDNGNGTFEIVDGYHRWLASGTPKVHALTDGLVPVVVLPQADRALAQMATIRHNRARGVHGVLPMADIVNDLLDQGIDRKDLGKRLGMDQEEVDRLADRGDMRKRAGQADFGKGWTV